MSKICVAVTVMVLLKFCKRSHLPSIILHCTFALLKCKLWICVYSSVFAHCAATEPLHFDLGIPHLESPLSYGRWPHWACKAEELGPFGYWIQILYLISLSLSQCSFCGTLEPLWCQQKFALKDIPTVWSSRPHGTHLKGRAADMWMTSSAP